jgi:hypothetical protein
MRIAVDYIAIRPLSFIPGREQQRREEMMTEIPPSAMIPSKFRCLRCGYEWIPRSDTPPETCPNPRRSTVWWKAKEEKKEGCRLKYSVLDLRAHIGDAEEGSPAAAASPGG